MGESAGSLKVRTPWALFGEELDGWGKLDATNRQFVHQVMERRLGAFQIKGIWDVAANDPDLDPDTMTLLKNGFTWIAKTTNPVMPELAPAILPGIGGKPIYNGELIVWDEINQIYVNHNISPLNFVQADARYVELTGDIMTGELALFGDPTVPMGAVPKQYLEDNYLPLTGGTLTGILKLSVIDLYDPYAGQNPWWSIAVGGGAGLLPDFALIRYDQNGIPRGAPILINNTDPIVQGNAVINLNATVLLDREPTQDNQAATKLYVDRGVSGAQQFIGSFDASTSIANFIPGTLLPNGWLPDAAPEWANDYVIVNVRGTPAFGPPETRVLAEVGDWWICDGTTWFLLNVGSPSNLAANVAVNPPVFGESSVQDSLATAEATLVKKAGDNLTGSLNFLNIGNGLTFPGGMSFSSVAFDILGITAGTFLVSGAVTIGSTLNVTGLTSIANTLRVQSANNTGKIEIHGAASQTGEMSFYTQEGTRRGYIGYGSGGLMHIKAENGYRWQFDDWLGGTLGVVVGANSGTPAFIAQSTTNNTGATSSSMVFMEGSGAWNAWLYSYRVGWNNRPEAQLRCDSSVGGWGTQTVFNTTVNSPPGIYFNGDVSCTSLAQRCLLEMKSTVRDARMGEHKSAWSALKVRRFILNENYHDWGRERWGFVAEELPEEIAAYAAPGSSVPEEMVKKVEGIDIGQALALTIAKVKELEAEIAILKSKL